MNGPNRRDVVIGGLCAGVAPNALAAMPKRSSSLAALGAAKGIRFGSTIGLKNFTPGAYEAELVVTDALAGDARATATLPFRVIVRPPDPKKKDEG